ncbi:MAG: hypothetical protein JWN07_1524, partial [Hyphomicrobiales bacterium]|nr:hypothetical protein [Hyphomicrobiales bacterium]
ARGFTLLGSLALLGGLALGRSLALLRRFATLRRATAAVAAFRLSLRETNGGTHVGARGGERKGE